MKTTNLAGYLLVLITTLLFSCKKDEQQVVDTQNQVQIIIPPATSKWLCVYVNTNNALAYNSDTLQWATTSHFTITTQQYQINNINWYYDITTTSYSVDNNQLTTNHQHKWKAKKVGGTNDINYSSIDEYYVFKYDIIYSGDTLMLTKYDQNKQTINKSAFFAIKIIQLCNAFGTKKN